MKYFTYLAVSVMIIATISLFYIKKPNGQPWLTPSLVHSEAVLIKDKVITLSASVLNDITNEAKQVSKQIAASTFTSEPQSKIYKWQDAQGQWHFSDVPNKHGESVKVELDPSNVNVVVAQDTAILSGSAKSAVQPFSQKANDVYTAESIKKLFEDAEKAKQKLEQRSKEVGNFSGF